MKSDRHGSRRGAAAGVTPLKAGQWVATSRHRGGAPEIERTTFWEGPVVL